MSEEECKSGSEGIRPRRKKNDSRMIARMMNPSSYSFSRMISKSSYTSSNKSQFQSQYQSPAFQESNITTNTTNNNNNNNNNNSVFQPPINQSTVFSEPNNEAYFGFGTKNNNNNINNITMNVLNPNLIGYRPPINQSTALQGFAMMNVSSYRPSTTTTTSPGFSVQSSTNANPIIYSNRSENIDLCISCYSKVSDILKSKLNLSPGFKSVGSDYYWCDICKANIFVGDGPETKLQILLKLKDLNLTIENLVSSCQSSPWNFGIDVLYSELIAGGMLEQIAREICQKLV